MQVLEDGSDVCDWEHSDHGEKIPYSSAYTPDILGPDGKPKREGPQKLTSAQEL
jgi:hypothetical protein